MNVSSVFINQDLSNQVTIGKDRLCLRQFRIWLITCLVTGDAFITKQGDKRIHPVAGSFIV